MHALDINRCCFALVGVFFSSTLFFALYSFCFSLQIWILFEFNCRILFESRFPLCAPFSRLGCIAVAASDSIILRGPQSLTLALSFLDTGAGKSLSIHGGEEGRWLSPGHCVSLWEQFSLPLIFYELTDQQVFHRTRFLSCSLSCGQLKIAFAQWRQRTWFLNFLSQWCSPVFQLPGSPREEHFFFLASWHLLPPFLVQRGEIE